jgi:hypothetical protein
MNAPFHALFVDDAIADCCDVLAAIGILVEVEGLGEQARSGAALVLRAVEQTLRHELEQRRPWAKPNQGAPA